MHPKADRSATRLRTGRSARIVAPDLRCGFCWTTGTLSNRDASARAAITWAGSFSAAKPRRERNVSKRSVRLRRAWPQLAERIESGRLEKSVSTTTLRRPDSSVPTGAHVAPYLFLVMRCEAPFAEAVARFCLAEVDEVCLTRGAQTNSARERDAQTRRLQIRV